MVLIEKSLEKKDLPKESCCVWAYMVSGADFPAFCAEGCTICEYFLSLFVAAKVAHKVLC